MKLSSSENSIDVEIVDSEGRVLKTLEQHLREWMAIRNIPTDFYIEDEAKEMVLAALQDEHFKSAHIDDENGLVVEFLEEEKNEQRPIQPENENGLSES
jgi:hypothetical protein